MEPVDILLVEDNRADAELTIHALKRNHEITKLVHVKDGADALDFIFAEGEYSYRQIENKPKIILLDLKMPKVNGLEVLERLKSDKRTRDIPVIVLTSSRELPDIRACYDLGANSYVVKPVQFDAYVKTVTNLGLYWMVTNQATY